MEQIIKIILRVLSPVSFPPVLVFRIFSMFLKWSIGRLRAVGNPSTGATRLNLQSSLVGNLKFLWSGGVFK